MDLLLPFAGSGSALGARSRQAAGLYRRWSIEVPLP